MKIETMNFAFASAIAAAIIWTFFSALVWMMPGAMMDTTGNMVHMNMNGFGWMPSTYGFIWGLFAWGFFAGIFGLLQAAVYNGLTKNKQQ